jgi:hypothetical protein
MYELRHKNYTNSRNSKTNTQQTNLRKKESLLNVLDVQQNLWTFNKFKDIYI